MMRANAVYESQYLLGTSIARPLIAKAQIDIARKVGADTVVHGATGKGNDQCRFEFTYAALAPDLKVIAPWKMEEYRALFPGRAEMIAYCQKHDIPVEASLKKPYSMDRNLLHISYEAGILEDPWFDPTTPKNRAMFKLSVSPEDAPDKAEYVELEFVRGDCIAVNGKPLSPAGVMRALNRLGGKHGVGRVDLVENRFVGMKSRGVYETPGGTILMHAHRQIETLTMDREVMHLRDSLIPKYGELVYYGFWFAPEREALQALIDKSQEKVSGTVRLKLYKGNVITCGRKSRFSLYDPHIASMEGVQSTYNQSDAQGFIRLNGLRLSARYAAQGGPAEASKPKKAAKAAKK
jgi:argininosuccinate synthase